jgi:hypothetical protein
MVLGAQFNQSPQVTGMSEPLWSHVHWPEDFSVDVYDSEVDVLHFQWSASCEGTFDDPTARSVRFTPKVLPPQTCPNCRVTVLVTDERGGYTPRGTSFCVRP